MKIDYMKYVLAISLLLCVFSDALLAQPKEIITLDNPSFEDFPRAGMQPSRWFDCGQAYFPAETPPDVQPSPNPNEPFFSVSKKSQHGQTYLGMVARSNDSWEFVSQRLSLPMKAGKCYAFSIFLCRSDVYVSGVTNMDGTHNFTNPIKLRIWGGSGYCGKEKLLAESPAILNIDWKEYAFKFQATQDIKYIVLEAFYNTPVLLPYNGNLLLDNASNIIEMPCDKAPQLIVTTNRNKQQPIAALVPPKPAVSPSPRPTPPPTSRPVPPTRPPAVTPQPPKPVVSPPAKPTPPPAVAEVKKEKTIGELKSSDIKTGQIINIEKLYFATDSANVEKKNFPILNELVFFMAQNPRVTIEIGGHTNNRCEVDYCDQLSANRAKAVRDYLLAKGIESRRIEYKGYGSRNPVASNSTPEGRLKNQRVEVKILSING